MDAQRIEVLHVTDGDAVVPVVSDNLILNLLPSAKVLVDEDLVGGGEGFLGGVGCDQGDLWPGV